MATIDDINKILFDSIGEETWKDEDFVRKIVKIAEWEDIEFQGIVIGKIGIEKYDLLAAENYAEEYQDRLEEDLEGDVIEDEEFDYYEDIVPTEVELNKLLLDNIGEEKWRDDEFVKEIVEMAEEMGDIELQGIIIGKIGIEKYDLLAAENYAEKYQKALEENLEGEVIEDEKLDDTLTARAEAHEKRNTIIGQKARIKELQEKAHQAEKTKNQEH